MHNTDEPGQEWAGHYKWLLGGACALVLLLAGALVGLWSGSMERALDEIRESQRAIWKTLAERASLPGRTDELEERTDDQELRIRTLERRH